MNKQKTINLFLLGIFILIFFFEIIPVAVPNMQGSFGGFYYTSLLNEYSVGNYMGVGVVSFAFLTLFVSNKIVFGDK